MNSEEIAALDALDLRGANPEPRAMLDVARSCAIRLCPFYQPPAV